MSKRILIVDDDDDIRDVVQISLEEFAGWSVVTAASGREGLQLAKTEKLDAIVLDISMPDMDGFQLCAALQADPQTRNIPIVVLTAKALPSDRNRFAMLDIAGLITKPFDPMTVWKDIAERLPSS